VNANLIRVYVLGCVAVSGLLIASAVAETIDEDANPYAMISDKNVFHLNPPPPPPSAEAAKPPDLQKVMLSGFQKVGDRMKVYLAIPAKDPKDTAYLALQAGEKADDVEIVKIRADKQEVDIVNTGTPMTLTIASNGFTEGGGVVSKAGGAPPPGLPGNHRMPGMPGVLPPNMPMAAVPPPAPVSSGGSAIIVGGGEGNNGAPQSYGAPSYGSSSSYGGSPIVSGGAPSYVNTSAAAPNNPSAQIANSLFSGATGQYHPTPANIIPAPPEVQAAGLLLHQAAGGPPAPTGIEDQ
jgi:hypothetical protein